MRIDRSTLLMLLLMASALGVACGGEGGETPAALETPSISDAPAPAAAARGTGTGQLADVDACQLLTADEIRSATGHAPGDGANPLPNLSQRPAMCAWPSADGKVQQVVQVLVTNAPSGTFDAYRDLMAREQITITQIDGPGRFTVEIEGGSMIQSLGDRFLVQVMVEPAPGTDRRAASVRLAEAALGRLQ